MKKNDTQPFLFKGRRLKLFLVRKLFAVLILLCCGQINAAIYSQEAKITLKLEHASFKEMANELEQSTGYTFLYRDEQIRNITDLSIECKNKELKEILDSCLAGTGLNYRMVDRTIIIVKDPVSQPQQAKLMRITGQVLTKDKESIPGVTIRLEGTTIGTSTDMDGNFVLQIPKGENQTLEFTFVGMKPQKIRVSDEKTLVVIMEHDITEMEEVVVSGIFNKSKESYTGSVTTVSEKQLKMFKGQNLLTTLRNIDPSINIISNNSVGSDPNVLPEINIRGNSSLPTSIQELNQNATKQLNAPLVIMDGFEISLQKLMDFNDEEISSINILKDASATAIYGSRGANGVIVVTTRAPQAGKMKIFAQAGINIEIPDLSSYDLLNAIEKLALEKRVGLYDADEGDPTADRKLKERYNARLEEALSGVDTYWLSQPLQTGIGQKYNLRLEGGSNEFRWGTSLSYNNVQGAMKGSERNTFSGSVTLSYTYKNVIFRNQTTLDYNKAKNSKYGSFSTYAKMNPYWRVRDEEGELIQTYELAAGGSVGNPLYDASLNVVDQNKYNQVINNFSIEWNIIDNLKLKAQLGVNKGHNSSDYFLPPTHSKFQTGSYDGENSFRKGSYTYSTGESTDLDGNVTLSYSKIFADKHQIYAGVDYSIAEHKENDYSFSAEGFSSEDMHYLSNALQYTEGSKPQGSKNVTRRIGVTGNLNYTYDNRYYLDGSYRIDGSSQFGSKNKFAPFWSLGIGWNIHNEKFLQDNPIVNKLKIRGSYGETGSQQFSPYQALSTFQYYTSEKYLVWNGAELMGLGNEKLKWQITKEMNGGIEVELFRNRLSASLDVYQKKTSNLLSQMDLPLANGFSSYTDNVGEVKNYGYELSLSGYLIRNTEKNIIWMITGKMAYNKDKITKLSQAIKNQTENYKQQNVEYTKLLYEGKSLYSIYAVPSLGIDPSTGEEIFLDKDGNATNSWQPSAKRYAGISEPKYRGNISSMFMWKDLTVNLSFGYHWGGQQYNETLIDKVEITNSQAQLNADRRVWTERWQNPGDVKFFKNYGNEETKATTRFVMDDKVFELQSASVQYRWHSDFLKQRFSLESLTFNVNMSDIFYISSIKRERGISYPFARRVNLSIALMF